MRISHFKAKNYKGELRYGCQTTNADKGRVNEVTLVAMAQRQCLFPLLGKGWATVTTIVPQVFLIPLTENTHIRASRSYN